MMLALETAVMHGASVALLDGDDLVRQTALKDARNVAARLIPEVLALLDAAGVAAQRVRSIAVDCGPGSFTGIRIGIATARGLADGWGIPVWGVSQFDAFPAASAGQARLVLIDAGYGRGVYYQIEHGADVKRGFSPIEELEKIEAIACGNGIVMGWRDGVKLDERRWRWSEQSVNTNADAIGRAALRLKAAGKELAAEPLYLHTHAYAKSAGKEQPMKSLER